MLVENDSLAEDTGEDTQSHSPVNRNTDVPEENLRPVEAIIDRPEKAQRIGASEDDIKTPVAERDALDMDVPMPSIEVEPHTPGTHGVGKRKALRRKPKSARSPKRNNRGGRTPDTLVPGSSLHMRSSSIPESNVDPYGRARKNPSYNSFSPLTSGGASLNAGHFEERVRDTKKGGRGRCSMTTRAATNPSPSQGPPSHRPRMELDGDS